MSLFTRNLNRCGHNVTIEERDERILNGRSSEVFTNPIVVRAIVKTPRGLSVFDGTNTERAVTHELCLSAVRHVQLAQVNFSGLVATVTTPSAHGLKTGYVGTITGASQDEYNLAGVTITVISDTQFTYPLESEPTGSAMGAPPYDVPFVPGPIDDVLAFSYVQEYTSENWVTLKTKRLRVLSVINCCEKDVSLKLMCTERGDDSLAVNRA